MVDYYARRVWAVRALVLVVTVIFIVQLFNLQILNDYKEAANSNAFFRHTIYAPRGLIYDRNGKLLVFNQPIYDVEIVMKDLDDQQRDGHPIDTLMLCNALNISYRNFLGRISDIKNKRKNPGYSPLIPQRLLTQLSPADAAKVQELSYLFSGIIIQNRTMREYNYPNAAHALGSIGEVSRDKLLNDPSYRMGDYIGVSGVEYQYEEALRGVNGQEILLRDARGKIQGRYEDGKYDVSPEAGKNLTLSIDVNLQAYGEWLMQNKVGSIVCIEPSTGEILALVSSPTYAPSILVGRQRTENYTKLLKDPCKPLLDRPLMAHYPPGSTFKTVNALVFQQEDIITEHTYYPCAYGYTSGSFHLRCHGHASPVDLPNSISNSCNAYYCYALRAMLDSKKYSSIHEAFDAWKHAIISFGFGYRLGVDFPNESRGFIPNTAVYDRRHGKKQWRSLNIVSISIGQGEITTTPIQLANLAATIANRGYWIRPHVLKQMEGVAPDTAYTNRRYTSVDSGYFWPVIQGMEWAVNGGGTGSTARGARLDDIIICGKTGTAENPHGNDHSIFMAFAPKDNPQIAISVVVENAGFGAAWAAPIASLMVEKYLKDNIAPHRQWLEDRIVKANLLPVKVY
ncbi:MAG: penicillin-binding protein 2 [Prevotellaceae bacterium]|jgi:penicillin-binding protein 2|nr:penicillin-binding protein 2 [Prevotellaceae bacterium]